VSLVHNERAKLTANFLNALSSGVTIAGFVAPLIAVGVGFQPAPVPPGSWWPPERLQP